MPDTASITTIKRSTYRGNPEEWGNTYHFTGTTPANAAAWRTLANAIWNLERPLIFPGTTMVAAYGYEPGNDHSVAQIDFITTLPTNVDGSYANGSDRRWAGDQAGWIRAYVGQSATGKKVYIRKYYHYGAANPGNVDSTADDWRTKAGLLAAGLLAGTLPGSATWCSPQGTVGTTPTVSQFVTTRTLKRRGKRPS